MIRIAISGKSGCGNTSVSKHLAEKLNLSFINFTFKNLAAEHNLSVKEVLEKAAVDDWWDKEVDLRQITLAHADKVRGCVLGSRLAIWMLRSACLKVYLKADADIRVARIHKREGGNIEELTAFTAERDKQDHDRYMRIYRIDNDNYELADMVLDAGILTVTDIVEKIIERLKADNRL
jgi:cytidylate kinase